MTNFHCFQKLIKMSCLRFILFLLISDYHNWVMHFSGTEAAVMDFSLSPELKDWHDRAYKFAKEHLNDDILERDSRAEFWREGWKRAANFGVTGLPVPQEFGGQGLGLPETIAAMEGLGYGSYDSGLVFAMNATLWTNTIPILLYGTEAQKSRWLPGLCDGTYIGANGASEPEAGSDIFSMTSPAVRDGDGWVINGQKTWITAGPVADVYVCYAVTDPTKGILGISAFIIPRDAPGLRVVRTIPKMGVKTVPMGEIALENCRVGADALLGREGRGAEVFNCSMEWERGAILAATLGTMRRQLERCCEYARRRNQFGQQISRFQSVSNRLALMKIRLETCRPMVYKIGWLKAQGKDATIESAMAKYHVSECFVQNSLDAVRTFGARGFISENLVEKDLRDSIGSLLYSGTNDIQLNIIAKSMRL
jgi:alkylation response protein AidB-like acyl-CoA dehydrogenase